MNTTNRRIILVLGVVGIILLVCFLSPFISNRLGKTAQSGDVYSVKTFQWGDGWGYQINKEESLIILQPYIPCLVGENPFPDEKSAKEVGEFVLSKLKRTGDPSITIEELHRICPRVLEELA